MPTYTYRCKNCNKTQDEFHSISANPRIKCKACGGPCKRMIGTGAGVIFKGSGFYETDYKTRKGGAGTETAKAESGSESSSGGSESKTETKTESKPKKAEKAKSNTSSE